MCEVNDRLSAVAASAHFTPVPPQAHPWMHTPAPVHVEEGSPVHLSSEYTTYHASSYVHVNLWSSSYEQISINPQQLFPQALNLYQQTLSLTHLPSPVLHLQLL